MYFFGKYLFFFSQAYKERWKKELSQDEMTPKRQRDATLQSQKENLKQMEAQEEQRLARGQREYLDLEIRKFRRKKLLNFHTLEQELLREVSLIIFFPPKSKFFILF